MGTASRQLRTGDAAVLWLREPALPVLVRGGNGRWRGADGGTVAVLGWCKDGLARLWRAGRALPASPTGQNQDMSRRISPLLRAKAGALPANARLVIIGGRFEADNRPVFEAIAELSGGRVAVLPTASSEPREAGEETRDSFRAYGIASEVIALDKDNYRTAAFDPKLVALLERYGSFYFTGGDQALIVQALIQDGKPTPALQAIRAAWAAGGLVSGSSAGAAIMSDPMITSGSSVEALVHPPAAEPHDTRLSIGRGLGFFPLGLVDQHFLQRGRLGRLVAALLATGGRHGFGIDENTAMVIAGGRLTRPGRDRADPRRRRAADRQAGGRGSGRAQAQLSRPRRQPGSGLAQGAARAGQAAGARARALLPRTDPGRQGGVRRLHHARDPGPAGRGRPRPLPQRDHLGLRPCQRQRGRGRDDPRAACQGADRAWRPRACG